MIRTVEHTREYPGHPETVRSVRHLVAGLLGGWPSADDAVLAASEAAGNAVRWSRSGERDGSYLVRVVVTPLTQAVVYTVDRGCRAGHVAAGEGDGGRGLRLIAHLAQAWGIARPGCGAWAGETAGEPQTAAGLATLRAGTCVWFRVGWQPAGRPAAEPPVRAAVLERAERRCECRGVCGRSHRGRCVAEQAEGRPLHLVPVWPAAEAVAAHLPAAVLVALCGDCDTAAVRAPAFASAAQPGAALFTIPAHEEV